MVCSGVILLSSVVGWYEEASDDAVYGMLIMYRRLCIAVIIGTLFGTQKAFSSCSAVYDEIDGETPRSKNLLSDCLWKWLVLCY